MWQTGPLRVPAAQARFAGSTSAAAFCSVDLLLLLRNDCVRRDQSK